MVIIIEDLLNFINNIPLILQYIIPGYLGIQLFAFISSKKVNQKTAIISGTILSYLLLSFWSLIRCIDKLKFTTQLVPDTPLVNSAIISIFCIILSVIFGIVFTRDKFKDFIIKFFNKTPHDSIWRDVLNFKEGSNLKVYLKDKPYYIIGRHHISEENGDDSWFSIKAYGKYDILTDEPYNNRLVYHDDNNVCIVVRLANIDYIEIF